MTGRRTLYLPCLILLGAGAACAANPGSTTVMADTDSVLSSSVSSRPAPRVQLIVSFEDGTSVDAMHAACAATGATFVRSVSWAPAMVVLLPEGMTAEEGIVRFRAQPGVINVEVDRQVRAEPVRGPNVGK
ncbi:hypothetical protein RKE25_01095 [Dyella sp. BiH032]|uniref:S8 family serine peptidase n=1 Tax=Dyella sp. BiH032 TaxID=3075430 RepID=UPI0028931F8C|nr:hypothetical protein [Dyella sp. BiH032]WNL46259.1 hypothetical protein RKE25_01095 [Dyella sp. BiH032]